MTSGSWSAPMPADLLLASVAWLYLATNALRVFSYLPQIHAVWRCADGAVSISLLTWGSWVLSHVFAVMYGVLVMRDAPFVAISLINLLGCGAVTVIAMRRRRQWRRWRARDASPPCDAPTTG